MTRLAPGCTASSTNGKDHEFVCQGGGIIKDFFLLSGIVIMGMGLIRMIRPLAFMGAPGGRAGLSILVAGALIALASSLTPPDVVAASGVRARLMSTLNDTQPARQQVVERWVEAQAALPGGKVPARFLRWNTTDPEFGTNLNLIPAAAHTEGLKPEEIIARSVTIPLERVSQNPTGHVGTLLKYSGKVLYATKLPLDSSIAQVLHRSDTFFTVIWVQVGDARRFQFIMFNGPEDLAIGDPVTAYGYMLGVVNIESKVPTLFGKVLERK